MVIHLKNHIPGKDPKVSVIQLMLCFWWDIKECYTTYILQVYIYETCWPSVVPLQVTVLFIRDQRKGNRVSCHIPSGSSEQSTCHLLPSRHETQI